MPEKAKYPKISNLAYKLADLEEYQRTYVPGESELTSRLLGIEPKYEYKHKARPVDEFFKEHMIKDYGKEKKYNQHLWDFYISKSLTNEGDKKYKPSESPITETKPGVFEANPKTQFGKNFQRRIDLAFIRSKLIDKDHNPDQGYRKMRKGEEPLLGDIYFEDDGSFSDLWNISLDPHEVPMANPTNIARSLFSPMLEVNTPTIKGKASKWAVDYSKKFKKD